MTTAIGLRLSNQELAEQISQCSPEAFRANAALQKQVDALSPTEKQMVQLYMMAREEGPAELVAVRQRAFECFVCDAIAQGKAPGYAKPADPLESVKQSPEYKAIEAELADLEKTFEFQGVSYSLMDLINIVDQDNVGSGDGIVWRKDVEHTAHWQNGTNNLREFAARILSDPRIRGMLEKLTGGFRDGVMSVASLRQRIDELKSRKSQLEADAMAKASAQSGATQTAPATNTPPTDGASATTGASNASQPDSPPGTSATSSSVSPVKIDMGEVSGGDPLTRSTQRLTNALGSIEEQIDALVAQMGKETDPAKQRQLEAQLRVLERLQSTFSKMLERLENMVMNLANMYHKIQMTAIQNIGR